MAALKQKWSSIHFRRIGLFGSFSRPSPFSMPKRIQARPPHCLQQLASCGPLVGLLVTSSRSTALGCWLN